ncbi:xanthine dehydrogenase family protein molybdopterin-binding subunit [Sinorhizobium fredii]|uniref:xanthine dehydrogenase family protein molybdopterin-binding subunit n=2 Tax=Rhizobium fredii TaxID=380 RepID=UPI0004B0056C|nr:molybdopterin cofactor-binding domain-containing protein [Sinorhizobium fredii]
MNETMVQHMRGEPTIKRRHFLQGAAGLIAVTVVGPPNQANASSVPGASMVVPEPVPGIASERIDGRAKVTGEKVFARDFNSADMGWGREQWYALYLPALTTEHKFLNVDLSHLPEDAKPARVILGDQLKSAVRAAPLARYRDLQLEAAAIDQQEKGLAELFRTPLAASVKAFAAKGSSSVEFDIIVKPGNVPNYLGQAVALLMFDKREAYRAAKRCMQFNDASFQIYALDDAASKDIGAPWSPQTTYVKYFEGGETFSYVTADAATYQANVPAYRDKINQYLAQNSDLIRQSFIVDTQAMDPMFMEPESGLAYYDAEAKSLSLVLGTQSPDGDVSSAASMFSGADSPILVKEVILHSCYPGGGFGGRDSSPFSQLLALTAAFSQGAPVKLAHNRFEQFRYGLKRPGAHIKGELVAGPDMKLRLVDATLDFNGGGLRNLSPYVANLAALCIGGSYDLPLANVFAQSKHTQDITGGSQRGFGGPEAFLAIETALDDIAASRGWDPIALRRANITDTGGRTIVGGPIDQELRLGEILDRAEAHPLWADRENLKADYAARGLTYGTGIALSMQAYGTSGDGMVAAILLDPDGNFTVQSDAVDMGNGSATTLGVVIGPILGANASAVDMGGYLLFSQTGLTTRGNGSDWSNPRWTAKGVGSSSACLTGLHQVHTVQQTALALMQGSILPAAAAIWGRQDLRPNDVEWVAGRLALVKGGAEPIARVDLAKIIYSKGLPRGALGHAFIQGRWVEADFTGPGGSMHLQLDGLSFYLPNVKDPTFVGRTNTKPPPAIARRYSRYVWAPCANVIGLTVDKASGSVKIENVLSILNAGRLLVPQLVSGQSQGGIAMAIGYSLMEDIPNGMAGPADGTWNLNRYHVPRWSDVPLNTVYEPGKRAQELVTLPESADDRGAGRGIAEAVMCSIAPAISNALRDALGRRYTSLPITPAKILEGLRV